MLGLLTCAALRENGFDTVYCSGLREIRSKFIDRFGATPLYSGKYGFLSIFFSFLHVYPRYLHVFFLFRKTKYDRTNFLRCLSM